jgi:hypothetical protein
MLDRSHIEMEVLEDGRMYCARRDHGGCGVFAHGGDGRITMIEGDSYS